MGWPVLSPEDYFYLGLIIFGHCFLILGLGYHISRQYSLRNSSFKEMIYEPYGISGPRRQLSNRNKSKQEYVNHFYAIVETGPLPSPVANRQTLYLPLK